MEVTIQCLASMDKRFGDSGLTDVHASPTTEPPDDIGIASNRDPLAPRPEFLKNISDILNSESNPSQNSEKLLTDLRGALNSLETLVGDLEKTSSAEHKRSQQYIRSAFQSRYTDALHNESKAIAEKSETLQDMQKLAGIQARLGDLINGGQASESDRNPNNWTHSGRTFNAIEEYSSAPGNVQISSNDHEESSSSNANIISNDNSESEIFSEPPDSNSDAIKDEERIPESPEKVDHLTNQLIHPANNSEIDEAEQVDLSANTNSESSEDIALSSAPTNPPRFGLVTGGALLLGRVALAIVTGGTIPLLDGGKDVFVGTRDGNIDRAAVGAAKLAAGAAILIGIASANPALFAGGVIIYSGCLLYEYRDDITHFGKHR